MNIETTNIAIKLLKRKFRIFTPYWFFIILILLVIFMNPISNGLNQIYIVNNQVRNEGDILMKTSFDDNITRLSQTIESIANEIDYIQEINDFDFVSQEVSTTFYVDHQPAKLFIVSDEFAIDRFGYNTTMISHPKENAYEISYTYFDNNTAVKFVNHTFIMDAQPIDKSIVLSEFENFGQSIYSYYNSKSVNTIDIVVPISYLDEMFDNLSLLTTLLSIQLKFEITEELSINVQNFLQMTENLENSLQLVIEQFFRVDRITNQVNDRIIDRIDQTEFSIQNIFLIPLVLSLLFYYNFYLIRNVVGSLSSEFNLLRQRGGNTKLIQDIKFNLFVIVPIVPIFLLNLGIYIFFDYFLISSTSGSLLIPFLTGMLFFYLGTYSHNRDLSTQNSTQNLGNQIFSQRLLLYILLIITLIGVIAFIINFNTISFLLLFTTLSLFPLYLLKIGFDMLNKTSDPLNILLSNFLKTNIRKYSTIGIITLLLLIGSFTLTDISVSSNQSQLQSSQNANLIVENFYLDESKLNSFQNIIGYEKIELDTLTSELTNLSIDGTIYAISIDFRSYIQTFDIDTGILTEGQIDDIVSGEKLAISPEFLRIYPDFVQNFNLSLHLTNETQFFDEFLEINFLPSVDRIIFGRERSPGQIFSSSNSYILIPNDLYHINSSSSSQMLLINDEVDQFGSPAHHKEIKDLYSTSTVAILPRTIQSDYVVSIQRRMSILLLLFSVVIIYYLLTLIEDNSMKIVLQWKKRGLSNKEYNMIQQRIYFGKWIGITGYILVLSTIRTVLKYFIAPHLFNYDVSIWYMWVPLVIVFVYEQFRNQLVRNFDK